MEKPSTFISTKLKARSPWSSGTVSERSTGKYRNKKKIQLYVINHISISDVTTGVFNQQLKAKTTTATSLIELLIWY